LIVALTSLAQGYAKPVTAGARQLIDTISGEQNLSRAQWGINRAIRSHILRCSRLDS
jgi:hypothetical protein